MSFLFTIALVAGCLQVLRENRGMPNWLERRTLPASFVWIGAIVLPFGYAAHLAIFEFAARYERAGNADWIATIPFALVYRGPLPGSVAHGPCEIGLLAAVALETLGLIGLAFGRRTVSNRLALFGAGFVLAVLSISSTVLTSTDVLGYARFGTLGLRSYEHANVAPSGEFGFLAHHVLMSTNIYGPLWTLANATVTSFGTTLFEKVIALRIGNALELLTATFVIRRLRFRPSVVALFALNPMFWLYFVMNAHNDMLPLLLTIVAIAVARQFPVIAIALIAAAGAMKVVFLFIGFAVVTHFRSRIGALTAIAIAIAISAIVSWTLAGPLYLTNLRTIATLKTAPESPITRIVALTMVAIALVVITISLARRKSGVAIAFLYPLIVPSPLPWYFIWGLPYAVVARRGLATTLVILPTAAVLGDGVIDMANILGLVMFCAIIALAAELVTRALVILRLRFRSDTPPSPLEIVPDRLTGAKMRRHS